MQAWRVPPVTVVRAVVAALIGLTLLGGGLVGAGVGGVRLGSRGLEQASQSPGTARPLGAADTGAASRTPGQETIQLEALDRLLRERSAAVLAGDRVAWLRTVDPVDTAFRARQAAVFGNLVEVPFADWSYQYLGRAPIPERRRERGGEVWVAHVLADYRLAGYDHKPSSTEQFLTMVRRGGQWFVGSDSDGPTVPQPWDLGRVHVVQGKRVLVLGTAPQATLLRYARTGDVAVEQVSRVWGSGWTQQAVLLVPRSQAEFGGLLQRSAQGLAQVAAVTIGDLTLAVHDSGPEPAGGRAGNDRVVLNPAAFARLGALGRQVVLTHELSHVAVRQSTAVAVPTWLSEGFADYVAYRDAGVSRQVGAADLLVQVRSGRGPRSLPDEDAFDPTRTAIAPAYSAAWLACGLIADRYGMDRLVAFYRRAAAGQAPEVRPDPQAQLAEAFERVLGVSQPRFTTRWRQYLGDLAGR